MPNLKFMVLKPGDVLIPGKDAVSENASKGLQLRISRYIKPNITWLPRLKATYHKLHKEFNCPLLLYLISGISAICPYCFIHY